MNIKRYYRKDFPEPEDIVMAQVVNKNEYGYNVSLLEYDNLTGFISLADLMNGKYLQKKYMLKDNEILSLAVKEADVAKKIVLLSRKNISEEEVSNTALRYKMCTCINRLMNEIYTMYLKFSDIHSSDIIHSINNVMDDTIWRLYTEDSDYGYIYMKILENPKILLPSELFTDEFIEKALKNINNRIIKQNMILELGITLLILEEDALNKIKDVLTFNIDEKDVRITTCVMSPPTYKVKIECSDKGKGYRILEDIKNSIQEKSKKYASKVKFDDSTLSSDISYDIKFLADYDLKRLELV
ncbi:translation initiation factor eIF-2 alpha subunit [Klosneuvirus KNV1]|uniref:Translation initiation factor eIF-2 alpha subunit n=1 Tax=Klosneuvirus KNV1 TaxID=1977640 RepID=A0A1V0SJC8_9VIRU|nr:translation initiation factor eIF-2 alpha subunit [Klosneuvirus KNV1]